MSMTLNEYDFIHFNGLGKIENKIPQLSHKPVYMVLFCHLCI